MTVFGVHEHAGHVRQLVLSLKYGANMGMAVALAECIAAAVRSEIAASSIDTVTWAPTTFERRSSRGFDQAEVIARHAAAMCGLRVRCLLRRTNSGSQTRSSRADRLERPRFVARPRVRGHVLVIDDVVTTGATFVAAATALIDSGASAVTCIAATWTAARGDLSPAHPSR